MLSGGTFDGGVGIAGATPVAPDTPIATPDQYTIPNDQTLSVSAPGFLANDVDPEGETLTGTAIIDSPDDGVLSAFPDHSGDTVDLGVVA